MALSPYESHTHQFLAEPYHVLPARSLPLFAFEKGSACGHGQIAAAMAIMGSRALYCPYELAVAQVKAELERDESEAGNAVSEQLAPPARSQDPLKDVFGNELPAGVAITGTQIRDIPKLLEHCGRSTNGNGLGGGSGSLRTGNTGLHAVVEPCFFFRPRPDKDGNSVAEEDERLFTDHISSYLYQGIPVLFSVDVTRLYSEHTDDGLFAAKPSDPNDDVWDDPDRETGLGNGHIILIHSLLHEGRRGRCGRGAAPMLVYSDSRDLHKTGSLYQRVTAKRLWASRSSKPKEKICQAARHKGEDPATTERTNRAFVEKGEPHFEGELCVLLPNEFRQTYQHMRVFIGAALGAEWMFTLRDRSQLRGFLLNRIEAPWVPAPVPDDPDDAAVRKFREACRDLLLPRYVWIAEKPEDSTTAGGPFERGRVFSAGAAEEHEDTWPEPKQIGCYNSSKKAFCLYDQTRYVFCKPAENCLETGETSDPEFKGLVADLEETDD